MTTVAPPPTTAPTDPPSLTPPLAPAPDASTPAPDVSTPASDASTPASPRDRSAILWRVLAVIAVAGGAVVAGIGFAGSYSALKSLAESKGFGDFSPAFPIGVDAGIVVALALDLYLARRGLSWPWLRPVAHGLTLATIYFNANSGPRSPLEDPVAAAMHAVMPLLFVVAVEAARFLVVRTADLEAGRDTGGVPLLRWLLSPARTWSMWRRMKLWGLSYSAVVAREQALRVYRVMLERKHGKAKHAPSDERLPLTMARYGLTVDEALALPQKAEEREQRRREEEADRKVQEEIRAKEREAERRKAALKADGSVKTTEVEVGAQTTAAERLAALEAEELDSATLAEARARKAAAEAREAEETARRKEADRKAAEEELRAAKLRMEADKAEKIAQAETQAIETAQIAEARAREAAANRKAAEEELEAARLRAEADAATRAAEREEEAIETQRAAEARQRAAEAEERAAGALARAAEEKRAAERAEAEATEERARKKAADLAAAEAEARAAEVRKAAAEAELRAVELEDLAKLKPAERNARKVARMILSEASGEVERLPLGRIAEVLGVGESTASDYRKAAAALLADGYRP